jgi:hypothetical protein
VPQADKLLRPGEPVRIPTDAVNPTTVLSFRANSSDTGATPGSTSIRWRRHTACTSLKRFRNLEEESET